MSSMLVLSSLSRACTVAAVTTLLLTLAFTIDQTATAAVDAEVTSTEFTDTTVNNDLPLTTTTEPPQVLINPSVQTKNGDIYSFIVHSKIKYRYAQTVVSSRVANKGNTSHEVQFLVTLPETAFVSEFLMEINDKVYKAYVKEKEEAKEEYVAALNSGQTAAHVELNARDSNKFTVSVNVEAESKVTFNLTYEQLLTRKLGIYENVINVQPGQIVKNLQVIVDIEESSNITTLEVPDIKTLNEIDTTTSKNKLAQISRESGSKATITWSPTIKEQLSFTERGVKGQFLVQYDVDHESTPNQVLIDDGYFVHFFAPADLKPLRTHVIFVLDVSGSMLGQKLPQVKDAMKQILSEIHPEDFFTLILFSDFAQVWTINATQATSFRWDGTEDTAVTSNHSLEALGENRFVFPATEENIQHAKKFIQDLTSESSTNMEDALTKALIIAKSGKTRFKNGPNTPKPIIVFLTDGEPTTGISEPQELIKYVSNTNEAKYPIFSLGFGDGADIDFLKKLSLNNTGFARVIYEASDASLQLRNFYKEISSPVLSNVTFKYVDSQVDNITVTKKSFNLLFRGTELIVAGKLNDSESGLDFKSILNAESLEGNLERPSVVTCFDIPIIPPVAQNKPIGHLEKLWAYLSIKQLMDEYELNKSENSTSKAEALALALKYSFVTPLTSLVVVKPNDTVTSADPEKIKPHNNKHNFGSLMASNPGYQSLILSSPVNGFSHISTGNKKTNNLQPSLMMVAAASPPIVQSEMTGNTAAAFEEETSSTEITNKTFSIDNLETPPQKNNTSLHDISVLKWLTVSNNTTPSITLNGTDTVYQVLMNTNDQSYQNCTTSDNMQGNCKHLRDCVVDSIINSFEDYIPLFCPVENVYAGICCLI